MAKINIRERDPKRYEEVKAMQEALSKECSVRLKLARVCPYCGHTVSYVCKGSHSYAQEKCPNCGENVTFPPISFRVGHRA